VERVTGDIVTLRVSLDDVEPPVWRRLEIPAEYSFDRLHQVLNAAMGWLDLHLHEFRVAGKAYGDGVDMSVEADATLPEEDLVLGDVARGGEKRLAYWYDFGDDWWHTVEIEAVGPAEAGVSYPRCTAGAGACPPEDCGGPPGFEDFKRAMADPADPEHAELKEWYGDDFDPEAFSVEATSELLRLVATGRLPRDEN
jgi:hypothetical protein